MHALQGPGSPNMDKHREAESAMQAEGISEAPECLQIKDEHNELIRLLPFATMHLQAPALTMI